MANEKKDEETSRSQEQVPASYAEKAMSSLLRLHDDLVEEKEKRIDLYRRLMEREQELAEVRSYVQLLESELARQGALPPGASGFLPGPGPGREPEQRRLQQDPTGSESQRWSEPDPQPWSAPAAPQNPRAQPAREWQPSQDSTPSQAAPRSEGSQPSKNPNTEGTSASQPSQGRGPQPPEEGSSQPPEPPKGRAPVVAWVPFNSGRRGGGPR